MDDKCFTRVKSNHGFTAFGHFADALVSPMSVDVTAPVLMVMRGDRAVHDVDSRTFWLHPRHCRRQ